MSIEILQTKIGVSPDGNFGPVSLRAAIAYFKITTLVRGAHFFGQCAHETNNFKSFVENLNYTAQGLIINFPKHFDMINAPDYAHQPEKIANHVYANRMGNGDESLGNGWKYRGRGAIQLTGLKDYTAFNTYKPASNAIINPDILETEYCFETALYYFNVNRIWEICDFGVDVNTITRVTEKINGGTNGLGDRIIQTQKYMHMLK